MITVRLSEEQGAFVRARFPHMLIVQPDAPGVTILAMTRPAMASFAASLRGIAAREAGEERRLALCISREARDAARFSLEINSGL